MPIVHCTPRAVFTPLYTKENLFFCTEELGSESISTSIAATSACEAQSSQGLHRSFQEASGNRIFNARNRQGGETHIEDNDQLITACKSSYANNLSLSTHVRTFPPPISSLLSDRPIMRTLKFDGRFVLQVVDTISCTSPFSVIRGNGRLRLVVASLPSSGGLDSNEHSISRSKRDGYEEHGTGSQEEEDREEVKQPADKTMLISQNAIDLEAFPSPKEEMARSSSSIFVPRSMNILGCNGGDTSTLEFLPTILRFLLAKKLSKMGSYKYCKGSIRQHSSDHMQHNLLSISSIQSSSYSSLLNKTQLSN